MRVFLDTNFLLHNRTAERLYHDYAAKMPVIDYHNHLSPGQIATNYKFKNLTDAWLNSDHYKWRAMRANGVDEKYITGNAADEQKFEYWAATVPYTLRNPLYHWTHLELQRYFNIKTLLDANSAKAVYEECRNLLQSDEFSVQNLLRKMNVKILCTTDDPVDNLSFHQQIKQDGFEIKVLPAFRPDKAIEISNEKEFNTYLQQLENASGVSINSLDNYLQALKQRHDYFAANGCCISDHGLEAMCADDYTEAEIKNIFDLVRTGKQVTKEQQRQFKSYMLLLLAEWDFEKGWVQQYHLGPLRNVNTRLLKTAGADAGVDSISDVKQAAPLAKFLNTLNSKEKLAKTILYNLNPAYNEVFATMAGNFNDGSIPGKIQWGSAWWFLDQKDGMTNQINTLSNMGLLSRFVGMLTDSRSFLSFPRHEYFRRILCNILGTEMEMGELPTDIDWIGKMIQDICYNNAKEYFGWNDL